MSQPEWLNKQTYPFESHYYHLPEGKLHYVMEGQGEAMVMIHGTPEWSFVYRELIKAFRSQFCCIAADHLGFGLSDKPDISYAPELQAERLEQFLNHLKLKDITLIVHDFGGPIGLAYAQKYPEKIKRIVIMNSWLWPVKADPFYSVFSHLMLTPLGKWMYLQQSFSARVIMKRAFADKSQLSPDLHAQYLKVFPTPQSRKATLDYAQSFIKSDDWFTSLWQNRDKLKAIPAQFIWGMKDIAFKAKDLARFQSLFDHYETKNLAVGHFPQEEAPEEVISTVARFVEIGQSRETEHVH
ncbi:MAG: alpha/beta fold hydrolase [Trueperaceae bacterium]|nr:alpha/beta fold hydrolase [Trueperaceae bacterium]